jgi:hypothetical protein
MADILLDEVNTVATKTINPGVVDNYFKAGPLMAYLKKRFTRKWNGPLIQENYEYAAMRGGAYAKGGTFNTQRRQTRTGMLFTPRYYYVNVTEFLEDLEVEMAGPTATFSTLKADMGNAALTLSAILEIAMFHNGQNVNGVDRTKEINGLEESLTDGTNTTWTGATFPTYGGQTRAAVAPALNSPVGLIPVSNTTTSFNVLEQSFQSTTIGAERAKLGLTTTRMMGFIASTFTPQQKIDTLDPEINWPGMKFNTATIVQSNYCPGQDGVDDPDLGDYSADFENFLWLNPGPVGDDAFLRLFIAASPKFAFGFTGFKGAREDNQVSGQVLWGGNFTNRAPRLGRWLYGFTQ